MGMAYDEALAQRLRERLHGTAGVTEKKMFGGLAFITHGNMTVGVRGDELIARISPDDNDAALAESGVRPFDTGGRAAPAGWIMVSGETLDDPVLDRWIGQAATYVATLPRK
jgi:TfoX/Sxy family transcriptional regulator of competence genes